jgi:hypothetical protein
MKTWLKVALFACLVPSVFAQVRTQVCPKVYVRTTTVSGTPLTIDNIDCAAFHATFDESATGAPTITSVVIQGCSPSTCTTLETYNGTLPAQRKPVIDAAYNYFLVTPTWTGGTAPVFKVSVLATNANGGSGGVGGAVTTVAGRTGDIILAEGDIGSLTTDLTGKVPTTTTVNGHPLSSNVVVSATDISTGTLPHAQLPPLVSGDIPNNAANTSGTSANLSGTPALPNGTTGTTQAPGDNTTKLATDAYVGANSSGPPSGSQFDIQTNNGTGGLNAIPTGAALTGQLLTANNAGASTLKSPGVADGNGAAPVTTTPYVVKCDSATALLDRLTVIRLQTGASVVTSPDHTASGCGNNFAYTLYDDGAGSITVNRTGSDTFTVSDGYTNTQGATSFTLVTGNTATLTNGAGTVWEVRINRADASKVATSTTVNGHPLSSNVVVSASDISTGTLPHAQLPALVSGDIPNNSANTNGTAANLSGTPALPNGTTATTQSTADNSTQLATTAFVQANNTGGAVDASNINIGILSELHGGTGSGTAGHGGAPTFFDTSAKITTSLSFGFDATATAYNGLAYVTVGGAGNGAYTSTCTVAAPQTTGTTATCQAILSAGNVTSILITGYGKGYNAPPVVTVAGGSGQTFTAILTDFCGSVNNALKDAVANNINHVSARGFTGTQACQFDMFNGVQNTFSLEMGSTRVIATVPQWPVSLPHTVEGNTRGAATQSSGGAIIEACGSQSAIGSVTFASSQCTITTPNGTVVVPQFPAKASITSITVATGTGTIVWAAGVAPPYAKNNQAFIIQGTNQATCNSAFRFTSATTFAATSAVTGSVCVTATGGTAQEGLFFQTPLHAQFANGVYECVYCEGGGNSTEDGRGWNNDGFGYVLRNIKIDCGGNNNCFPLYNENMEETNLYDAVTFNHYADNSAGAFFDRTEAPSNQSGPTHIRFTHINAGGQRTSDAVTTAPTWGMVFEGSNAVCILTGGGGTGGSCFVDRISGGTPHVVLGYVGSGYTSGPTWVVWGAPTNYATPPIVDCTGTATQSGGLLTTIGSQCVATDYSNGGTAAMPEDLVATTNGASTGKMTGGVLIDGVQNAHITYLHTEFLTGDYSLRLGTGNNPVMGGMFTNVDTTSTNVTGLIRIAPGADGTQNFFSNQFTSSSGSPNLILDESLQFNGATSAKNITIPASAGIIFGSAKVLEFYSAGGRFYQPQTLQWMDAMGAITHLLGPTDQPFTILAGSLTGTNVVGKDLVLGTGLGTGNSTPGHIKLQAPSFSTTSGSTAQTQTTEYVVHKKAGSTTSATATNMFNLALAASQTGGFQIVVHVETTQATPQNCSTTETFNAVVQNTAATITSQTTAGTIGTICSTGTLTLAAAFSAANPSIFSVTPTWTTIVPTGVIITVEIHNLSQQEIALL